MYMFYLTKYICLTLLYINVFIHLCLYASWPKLLLELEKTGSLINLLFPSHYIIFCLGENSMLTTNPQSVDMSTGLNYLQ